MEEKKQHGGYRSGAGRKASLPKGARFRGINLTDEELKAVKELVAKMRGEKQMAKKVLLNGNEVDFDAAVNMMDDELREELHNKLAPCSDQDFMDAYAEAHQAKFGEQFEI